jgi:hypothetical protein
MKKIVVVACIFFVPLLCMDKPKKKDVACIPPANVAKVVSLLLERLDLLNHHMICSLAVTKGCDQVLMQAAERVKRYFFKQMHQMSVRITSLILDEKDAGKEFAVLHKYGGARITVKPRDNGRGAQFVIQRLSGGCCNYRSMPNCQVYISDVVRPRFNEIGNLYYYALDDVDKNDRKIIEHRRLLNVDQHLYRPVELVLYNKTSERCHINLVDFLSFPIFINACTKVLVESRAARVCYLKDICLSNDYTKCVPHDQCQYKSYVELPDWWREAIDGRYREQQKILM